MAVAPLFALDDHVNAQMRTLLCPSGEGRAMGCHDLLVSQKIVPPGLSSAELPGTAMWG